MGGELIRMKSGRHGVEPEDRHQVDRLRSRLGMVFQQFNLWSHLTVLQNVIEAPVHVLKLPKHQAVAQAKSLLDHPRRQRSASLTSSTTIPLTCRAASSSARQSPGRSP